MSKEGSLDAPTRHPIDFEHPDFLNPEKLDSEMRRVFDICHGCNRDKYRILFSFLSLIFQDLKNQGVQNRLDV